MIVNACSGCVAGVVFVHRGPCQKSLTTVSTSFLVSDISLLLYHSVSTVMSCACYHIQCVLPLVRVTTLPGKSWKVMQFSKTIFQAWKVMENNDDIQEFFYKNALEHLFL